MKTKSHFYLIFALLMLSMSPVVLISQERSALLDNQIAIFYPSGYVKANHTPSFTLPENLKEKGNLPSAWKTRVEFKNTFGKNMAYVAVEDGTDLYGTGEVTGSLIRNGKNIKLWNYDNYEYAKDNGMRLYQSHPWVLAVRKDGTAFGVLANNTWKQSITLGDGILFASDGPEFSVTVIEGENPKEVLEKLAQLTGKIDMPPLWSLGFQQCRWSYYPDSRVKGVADTFRMKKIPCDVIWMDIHYMNEYRIFTFSPKYFPNPKETNEYLHNKGFKSVWMIDPGVKAENGYFVYDSGSKEDVWVKDSTGKNFVGTVWPGDCVFPDFTKEATNKWWGALYKDFMATGVDGVWNDMNEPSVFNGVDGTMPKNNIHEKGSHLQYHNVYGIMMAKASKEGILKANPEKRPFLLTRSNFIGGQKYAATWTGDNKASWEHLRMSVPMSLNLGLSGQPFNGPDIGGFGENTTKELFTHWIALGAFYPFSRAHKTQKSISHELWSFGQETEDVARVAIERRYRLLPYLYTLFHESSVNGMPVMRPLFFADFKDLKLRKEQQAFLLGGDLMVIPKWAEYVAKPAGKWRTISIVGEESKNDKYQPELKIRPGAIIPMGEIIQNTTEYNTDIITLIVSLDQNGKASGQMYVDAGEGFGYKNGEYALLNFEAKTINNKVIISIAKIEGKYNVSNKLVKVKLVTDKEVLMGESQSLNTIEIAL